MKQGPRRAALPVLVVAGVLAIVPAHAGSAQQEPAGEIADVADVMISSVDGFELIDEQLSPAGALVRTFRGDDGTLHLSGFAVATPPGTRQMFSRLPKLQGAEFIDEPAVELGRWMVPTGTQPEDNAAVVLGFPTSDHIFTFRLDIAAGSSIDAVAFMRELAAEQVRLAGPLAAAVEGDEPSELDPELAALIPPSPPPGLGLERGSLTLDGFAEITEMANVDAEVTEFLNRRATGLVEVWGGDDLSVAVGFSKYPFEIFAAADLARYGDFDRLPVPPGHSLPRDAVMYELAEVGQIGIAFRRDEVLVVVLSDPLNGRGAANAALATVQLAELVDDRLGSGDTEPYEFPSPPTRLAALGLTGGLVVLAVAGTNVVARLRARRIRRRWASDDTPTPLPPLRTDGSVIALDADARALRRRGAVVSLVQLATIVVGVIALSGDFAWPGVFVAAASLVSGLAFTRWWLRREYTLLGPAAPRRALRAPRLSGAVVGVAAFATLGFGVAYALKGLRYLLFAPTLAQLRWADRFGITPRAVGVLFAVGGLAVTMLGAVLWRVARSLGRARVREVLAADHRPPVLYLRSFEDDALPLPSIASARRPLFELFSLRGADPFEECVAWELESYGPVVAVGRPGGTLASLGAAREHLSHESWHGEIEERMADAGTIALAPGETAGLEWELAAIVRGSHLGKVVFVFPPLPPADLARRWAHTSSILRAAGADVGDLPVSPALAHTATVRGGGTVRATWSRRRDEATYRTAVDRAAGGDGHVGGGDRADHGVLASVGAAPAIGAGGIVAAGQDGHDQA